MSKIECLKRYILFVIGLFVTALGVSFITKAQLGTSPISSVPYVLSLGLPLSMGTFTFLLNMVLIGGQIAVFKRDFNKIQLVQIPVSVVFGYFIDFTMSLLSFNPTVYILKIFFLLAGCIILALGVSIQVTADVVMLSAEAFVNGISLKFNKEFGSTKVIFDIALVATSVTISLLLFGNVTGVREGTVAAALIVGFLARLFCKLLRGVNHWFLVDESLLAREEEAEVN